MEVNQAIHRTISTPWYSIIKLFPCTTFAQPTNELGYEQNYEFKFWACENCIIIISKTASKYNFIIMTSLINNYDMTKRLQNTIAMFNN